MPDASLTISSPISAFVITFNNERTLEKTLTSLQWADEIVVVDSFSTDHTPDIAKRFATRFEQRSWPGFRDQYQYATDLCSHDWVLFADADEVLPQSLVNEIREELAANSKRPVATQVAGYEVQRRTWYINRWIMHGDWVPDREIRLFNRQRGRWCGGLHAKVHVDGPAGELQHYYYHYTYEDISDQLQTTDSYSGIAAREMFDAGQRFSILRLIGNPLGRFFRGYFLKRGFLDGLPGLAVSVSSMYYAFIKYLKLYELQKSQPGRTSLPEMPEPPATPRDQDESETQST
jgi:glycosyltransferase involved in cell wall biosynthesis